MINFPSHIIHLGSYNGFPGGYNRFGGEGVGLGLGGGYQYQQPNTLQQGYQQQGYF